MSPVIVLPIHDTDGLMFDHLAAITADLKTLFARAFIGLSPATERALPQRIAALQADSFFSLNFNHPDTQAGDHFLAVYQGAVDHSTPQQLLHLGNIDRVAFALQTEHRAEFVKHVTASQQQSLPVLYQRSIRAWESHPQNYRAVEHIATQVGELLLNQALDFAWCHLAIEAQHLKAILPRIKSHDFTILAEIVLQLRDELTVVDADWLAWEDPFIFATAAATFKQTRETSLAETRKRLRFLIPVLQLLLDTTEQ